MQWTERGVEDYEASDAFKRRSKMTGGPGGVSLSDEAREVLPTLKEFVASTDPQSKTYALENMLDSCFQLIFPAEARQLFVDKVCVFLWPQQ